VFFFYRSTYNFIASYQTAFHALKLTDRKFRHACMSPFICFLEAGVYTVYVIQIKPEDGTHHIDLWSPVELQIRLTIVYLAQLHVSTRLMLLLLLWGVTAFSLVVTESGLHYPSCFFRSVLLSISSSTVQLPYNLISARLLT